MYPPNPPYPVRLDIEYPDTLSRLLIFVKWLLAVPHFVVLYFYSMAFSIVSFIAWFAILFTGRYPRGLFDFAIGYMLWNSNVYAYCFLLRDEYPPFTSEQNAYPVQFSLRYPDRLSRWKIFLKWLLIIPNWLALYVLLLAVLATSVVAWFAILFTGRYPEGLFRFAVGVPQFEQKRASIDVSSPRIDIPARGGRQRIRHYRQRFTRWKSRVRRS